MQATSSPVQRKSAYLGLYGPQEKADIHPSRREDSIFGRKFVKHSSGGIQSALVKGGAGGPWEGKTETPIAHPEKMAEKKASVVDRLLSVKHNSGKSYTQLAGETGLTNVYVAQLLRKQAQLKPDTAQVLRQALPELTDDLLLEMMRPPMRSYDPIIIQDPTIYRLNEAIMHFGESVKDIINEEFGDGIMSAIDFFCSVDKVQGVDGKDRVVLTFDGKYLPHSEHKTEHMVSRLKK